MGKLLNKETIFAERINNNFTLRRDFKINSMAISLHPKNFGQLD